MGIETYRRKIDSLDTEITGLLKRRFEITDNIGRYKAENNLAVYSETRELEILNRVTSIAGSEYSDDIKSIYCMLLGRSRMRQNKLQGCNR